MSHLWKPATSQQDRPFQVQRCFKCPARRRRLTAAHTWEYRDYSVSSDDPVWVAEVPKCVDEADGPHEHDFTGDGPIQQCSFSGCGFIRCVLILPDLDTLVSMALWSRPEVNQDVKTGV